MELQIELNGKRTTIASGELFQYAAEGVVSPTTKLWVDGKETTCANVQGIKFGSATSGTNANVADVPKSTDDPRVVHTPFLNYFIGGGSVPYVLCYLEPGRSVFSSAGGRVWFKGDVQTENNAQGGLLKSLGRLVSGETLFMSTYTAKTDSQIAFATQMPGTIVPRVLAANESLVCQRRTFLAASPGVSIEMFFQKKIGAGLFGGEGFIMQKITGPGVVFLELDGSAVEYELQPGERVTCDTGALAWMDATCSLEIVMVKGLKNMLFGGEGLVDTLVTGPGKATFQTTSIRQFAGTLAPYVAKLVANHA